MKFQKTPYVLNYSGLKVLKCSYCGFTLQILVMNRLKRAILIFRQLILIGKIIFLILSLERNWVLKNEMLTKKEGVLKKITTNCVNLNITFKDQLVFNRIINDTPDIFKYWLLILIREGSNINEEELIFPNKGTE